MTTIPTLEELQTYFYNTSSHLLKLYLVIHTPVLYPF